jgi:hypothetical protein
MDRESGHGSPLRKKGHGYEMDGILNGVIETKKRPDFDMAATIKSAAGPDLGAHLRYIHGKPKKKKTPPNNRR